MLKRRDAEGAFRNVASTAAQVRSGKVKAAIRPACCNLMVAFVMGTNASEAKDHVPR